MPSSTPSTRPGSQTLSAPRRYIKVEKPVRVEVGKSFAEFLPHNGRRIEVEIDFANPLVGRQSFAAEIDETTFRKDIARARTFGFLAEVKTLWSRGFALGASLDNAVVIAEDRVMNPEGLRYRRTSSSATRRSMPSAISPSPTPRSLVATARIAAATGSMSWPLEALIADREAWSFVELPVRRESGHAELHVGAAAFGPDVS